MGETESKDRGCLIIFDELKEGDELFHILRGPVIVTELMEYDKDNPYRIGFTYQEDEAYIKIKTGTNDDSCTITGRLYTKDKYPAIYRIDPFKYTAELLHESQNKIKNLNEKIKRNSFEGRGIGGIGSIGITTASNLSDLSNYNRQLEAKNMRDYAEEQLKKRIKMEELRNIIIRDRDNKDLK